MKLRAKVLLITLAMGIFSQVLIIFLSQREVEKVILNDMAERVFSGGLPETLRTGFESKTEDQLLPLIQNALKQTGAAYAIALDGHGRVLAHTNVVETGKLYTDPLTREALKSMRPLSWKIFRGNRPILEISLPIWSGEKVASGEEFLFSKVDAAQKQIRLGTFQLGIPLEETLRTVDKISRHILWIMAPIAIMVLTVSLFVLEKFLWRLTLILKGTQRISGGEEGVKVEIQGRDELGSLALSFNKMSDDLSHMRKNLQEEVKTLESFVYTISHDLKAPVVSMHGMASLLKEKYGADLNDKVKHYVDRIIFNADFMEKLIVGLLELSRAGRKHGVGKRIEARRAIEEILQINKEFLEQKRVQVVIQDDFPRFQLEQTELTQLFQNLITNGAKFMGDRENPRIEIGGRAVDRGVEFFVRDNGIGIDPAYHEKIFDIFQRLQDVEAEGTGVGLAIVRKIVNLNKGRIRLESRLGAGTTVFVWLPETRPDAAEPNSPNLNPNLNIVKPALGSTGASLRGSPPNTTSRL